MNAFCDTRQIHANFCNKLLGIDRGNLMIETCLFISLVSLASNPIPLMSRERSSI